jgi:hypothetical protein
MTISIPDYIKQARRVSTPLIAVTTPDQPATIAAVVKSFNGKAPPVVAWDVIRGLRPLNAQAEEMLAKVIPQDAMGFPVGLNPAEALTIAGKFADRSILFFANGQRFIDSPPVMQAICNLRDPFKASQKTLILIGPDMPLPAELVQDVLLIDEPLPGEDRIKEVIERTYGQAKEVKPDLADLDEKTLSHSVAALAGLAEFPAEQTCAMSINLESKILDVTQMWERKRGMINQTSGIHMLEDSSLPVFDDIGGLDAAKKFGPLYFVGPLRLEPSSGSMRSRRCSLVSEPLEPGIPVVYRRTNWAFSLENRNSIIGPDLSLLDHQEPESRILPDHWDELTVPQLLCLTLGP